MALALNHFRTIPQDAQWREQSFSDSVSVLVGCLTTAAKHAGELEEASVFDLVARASHRLDEVDQISTWLSEAHPDLGKHAIGDALSAIKIALMTLVAAWKDLPIGQRQNLLETSLRSLARFCYLTRPAGLATES